MSPRVTSVDSHQQKNPMQIFNAVCGPHGSAFVTFVPLLVHLVWTICPFSLVARAQVSVERGHQHRASRVPPHGKIYNT